MVANDSTQQGQEGQPSKPKKMREGERHRSSQSASNNNSANQTSSTGKQQSTGKPPSQRPAGIGFVVLIIIIIVATQFYLQNGEPLCDLPAVPSASSSSQPNSVNQSAPVAQPAFILLGEYGGKVYTYKQREKKVYVYNWQENKECPVCKLVDFDTFRWHKDGKLLVISRRHNTQGGIYLIDLREENPDPKQVLITDREAAPYFPRNLSIEESLPLVWSDKGESFAFVASDIHDKTQSLFIYNLDNQQNPAPAPNPSCIQNGDKLIYTPARHFERITDLVWINGDQELVFTAINDGQENRYSIDSSGGKFHIWDAQP